MKLYKRKILFSILLTLYIILILLLSMVFMGLGYSGSSVVYKYRFHRIFSAIATGFILGFVGGSLQSVLRNPLVDHHILGVGGGALFSVYLLYLFTPATSLFIVSIVAITGGLTALFIVISVSEAIGGSDIAYVLTGIGVSALFSGLSVTLSFIIASRNPYVIHLLLGSLIAVSYKWFIVQVILLMTASTCTVLFSKPLNTLVLGDEYAMQLGYNPRTYRFVVVIVSGVLASITVAYSGIIGFIGLVSPHISRLMLKTIDNRFVLPLSCLNGSLILLITDNFSRLILSGMYGEIPVGALTSAIGAPFFLLLLVKRFRGRV